MIERVHIDMRPIANVIAALLCWTGIAGAEELHRATVWDLKLGQPISAQPSPNEFRGFACGSDGGPPRQRLSGWSDFARCGAEPSGLHEVYFEYDDELEYIARAARDADAVARSNAMVVLGQPVILSLLIDRAGLAQGYRIITDPHADEELRMYAYTVAIAFKARFGTDGWACDQLAPGEGETPIAGTFVKERCRKVADGQEIVVESRYYYKPGQALLDPNTGLPTVNQCESSARMQMVAIDAVRK